MDRKTILNRQLAQNRLQRRRIYKTFWLLQSVALLLSSEEAILMIFIAFLPHFHKIEKLRNENAKIKHLID